MMFVLGIALLFGLLLAFENRSQGTTLLPRPAGLLRWLTSGNWPAKVGAGLLIVGTGALLRYLMLNIEFPPNVKLLAGVAVSTALGVASGAMRGRPSLRAVHLALGGASLGVAYLTAYSAYGYFGLIGELEALGGLFIVATAATTFAVSTRAASIAVLAMVGAFIAPAFALAQPEPAALLRYYLLASSLVLFMVWRQGWRPLIHLSFLFTLAGGAFFGWMQGLYSSAVYEQVHPLLLLNIALHLAMPLAEPAQSAVEPARNAWLRRFDLGYFLLLPMASLALTLSIAPDVRREGALGLAELGVLWIAAAGLQQLRFRAGATRFLLMALLFLFLSGLLWLGNPPYFLIGAVVACAFLAAGSDNGVPDELEGVLSAVVLVCTAGYLLDALGDMAHGTPILNTSFLRHFVLTMALATAGWRLRKQGSRFATVFLTIAATWFFVSCAREVARLHLEHTPQIVYLTLLALTFVYAAWARWSQPSVMAVRLLAGAHFLAAFVSATGFSFEALVPLMLAGHLAFSLLALLTARHQPDGDSVAGEARSLMPLLLLPWAIAFNQRLVHPHVSVVMTLLVCGALSASLQGQMAAQGKRAWPNPLSPLGFVLAAVWLFVQTLIYIERNAWAIAYELITLAYLLQALRAVQVGDGRDTGVFKAVGACAVLSVVLANILRWLGPNRVLSILDFNELLLPAVTSLVLASVGALITWASVGQQSRRMWAIGASILVCAALKLVFLDFGSLGQLGNILAMMGAGVVFLLVAWLVPIPLKAVDVPETEQEDVPSLSDADRPGFQKTQPMTMQVDVAAWPTVDQPVTAAVSEPGARLELLQRVNERLQASREEAAASGGNRWAWILLGLMAFAVYVNYSGRTRKPLSPVTTSQASDRSTGSKPNTVAIPTPARVPTPGQAHVPSVAAVKQPPLQSRCEFPDLKLPSDATVLVAGGYAGRSIDSQIDQSGHVATQMDVKVSQPGKPVVLMLGAYEPTVWNISWTADTRIVAILVSGYHRQLLARPDPSVPTLISSYDNKGECGYFYVEANNLSKLNSMSQRLFRRNVNMVYLEQNGTVEAGKAASGARWMTANGAQPVSYQDKAAALAGQGGLDEAVAKGLLRLATAADFDAWADVMAARALSGAAGQPTRQRPEFFQMQRSYVVMRDLTYPSGLFGAHAVIFIIPRGVSRPKGNPGHSAVLDFNTSRCEGALCSIL